MPENTTTNTTAEKKFEPVVLGTAVRNGQTVTIQTKEFRRQSKDREGANFVGVAPLGLEEMIKFIGAQECYDKLSSWLDQKCLGLWREAALNETGKKDDEVDDNELTWDNEKCNPVFINALQEWSALSETISDLRTKRDDYVKEMTELMLKAARGEIKQDAAFARGNDIAEAIRKLELDIAAKKRKTKAERDAEKKAAPAAPAVA